ncbi:hypothetical protein SynA1562_01027 [Synechococcus sp. A15-62]|nr:hypothetical protein SynA1562_01027 [Synechococcus sp. A15-62]
MKSSTASPEENLWNRVPTEWLMAMLMVWVWQLCGRHTGIEA